MLLILFETIVVFVTQFLPFLFTKEPAPSRYNTFPRFTICNVCNKFDMVNLGVVSSCVYRVKMFTVVCFIKTGEFRCGELFTSSVGS